MITYASSIINARLQTVFTAVDGSSVPGQMVVFDALNNALITFTLGSPSASIANRVAVLNNAIATTSLSGTPVSAVLQNGLGSLIATLNVPTDVAVIPTPLVAGSLASLVGQITGN